MKQGIVKFSKEFKTMTGNVWLGLENEYDMNAEDPLAVFKRAEETIQQYAQASGLVIYFDSNGLPLKEPSIELPIIDKAEERLLDLIEDSLTIEELMKYKNEVINYDRAFKRWNTKINNLKSIQQ